MLRVERHGVARLYPLTPQQQLLALHGTEGELAGLIAEVEAREADVFALDVLSEGKGA